MDSDRIILGGIGCLVVLLILVNIFLPGVWENYSSLLSILTFGIVSASLYLNHFKKPSSDIEIQPGDELKIRSEGKPNWEKDYPGKYALPFKAVNHGEMKGKVVRVDLADVEVTPKQEKEITSNTLQIKEEKIRRKSKGIGDTIQSLDHIRGKVVLPAGAVRHHGKIVEDFKALTFTLKFNIRDNQGTTTEKVKATADLESFFDKES
ncbi:hypothetical protein GKQ38_00790 [Candidatus Nanohaloarchaea archaeon]|nr:hypothetical protein GKQ38_00790 [Candidatus Nanohaloarchaea archaeon]